MPNRPKPTTLKLLEGNRGKRPINKAEPHPKRGMPTIPKWLRAFPDAIKEWRREARELDKMGVLTTADAGALAQRAYLGAELQQLAADIAKEGRVVDVKALDKNWKEVILNRKANPKCVQHANLLREYRALGVELGLGPASRTRLHVESQKPASKFSGLVRMAHGERQSEGS